MNWCCKHKKNPSKSYSWRCVETLLCLSMQLAKFQQYICVVNILVIPVVPAFLVIPASGHLVISTFWSFRSFFFRHSRSSSIAYMLLVLPRVCSALFFSSGHCLLIMMLQEEAERDFLKMANKIERKEKPSLIFLSRSQPPYTFSLVLTMKVNFCLFWEDESGKNIYFNSPRVNTAALAACCEKCLLSLMNRLFGLSYSTQAEWPGV